MSYNVEWLSFTDVSGQLVGPIRYPETSVKDYTKRCVISQKKADLVNIVAET
jgi:hypothetical protein